MAHGPSDLILVTIPMSDRITIRTHESEVRNPDSLDYRKSTYSGLRSKLHA